MDADSVIQKPTEEEICSRLRERFPEIEITRTEARRVYAKVPREKLKEACVYAHDVLSFEHCSVVTAVDYVDHLTVVYLLSNYWNGSMLELDADVPEGDLHIETVSDIWDGANWHERETWELFGIVFDGHPKLERLLTPQTYEFFPFRKSYKLRGQERWQTQLRRSSPPRRSSRPRPTRWRPTRCGSSWVPSTRSRTGSGP